MHSRPHILRAVLLAAFAVLLAAAALASASAPAAALETPTPTAQALTANAGWLAYAPAPERAGTTCYVDSGADLNADTSDVILHRESIQDGASLDDSAADKHGTQMVMVAFAPRNDDLQAGLWPHGRAVMLNGLPPGSSTFPFWNYQKGIWRCVELASTYNIVVIELALAGRAQPSAEQLAGLTDAVDYAIALGIPVVAGAGNHGGPVEYPAAYGPVIAVGGVDAAGSLCSISNRGVELDALAPGCGLDQVFLDAVYFGSFAIGRGTSQASDLWQTVYNALRSYAPSLSSSRVVQLLAQTVGPSGALDAAAAFRAAGLGQVVDAGLAAQAAAEQKPLADPPVQLPADTPPVTTPIVEQQKAAGEQLAERDPWASLRPASAQRWPTPRLAVRRGAARAIVFVSNRPRGARTEITVQRRGALGWTAGSRLVAASARVVVPRPRGRCRVAVRFVGGERAASATVRGTL